MHYHGMILRALESVVLESKVCGVAGTDHSKCWMVFLAYGLCYASAKPFPSSIANAPV